MKDLIQIGLKLDVISLFKREVQFSDKAMISSNPLKNTLVL